MILAVAGDARINALLAEIKIAIIARGAMIMDLGNGEVAAVAAYGKGGASSPARYDRGNR